MNISSAIVGADTETEVEVREYASSIEIRIVTPRAGLNSRPVFTYVDGKEVN